MALFKLIKEFESKLTELENAKPIWIVGKKINQYRIKNVKDRLESLKTEVINRKKNRKNETH